MLQLLAISDNFDVGIKDVKDGVKDGICAVNIIFIARIIYYSVILSVCAFLKYPIAMVEREVNFRNFDLVGSKLKKWKRPLQWRIRGCWGP